MAKAWRVILVIVLIVAIIGAVLLMVGLMTGADLDRTFSAIADKYGLVDDPAVYTEYFSELPAEIWASMKEKIPFLIENNIVIS